MSSRLLRISFVLLTSVAAACSSITEANTADSSLDLDSAHARWTASHLSNYSFELTTYTAMVPPQGPYLIEVRNEQVAGVRGAGVVLDMKLFSGRTVDSLYARMTNARATGELTEFHFNSDGVPLYVLIGTFANDGGVVYQIREFKRL